MQNTTQTPDRAAARRTRLRTSSALSLWMVGMLGACAAPPPAPQERKPASDPIATFHPEDLNLRVRRRPAGRYDLAQPAQLNVIEPAGGRRSQATIDAGLNWAPAAIQVVDGAEVGLVVEMHKNSAFRRPQESYQFGVMLGSDVVEQQDHKVRLDNTVALKTDKYNRYGLFAKTAASGVIPSIGAGADVEVGEHVLRWLPQVGINLEVSHEVYPSSLFTRGTGGSSLSPWVSVGGDFFPFHKSNEGRLWIHAEMTQWTQLIETGGFKRTRDNDNLFRASVNYALRADRGMSVGVEWGSGSNPEIGLHPAQYLMLNFGFMLGG